MKKKKRKSQKNKSELQIVPTYLKNDRTQQGTWHRIYQFSAARMSRPNTATNTELIKAVAKAAFRWATEETPTLVDGQKNTDPLHSASIDGMGCSLDIHSLIEEKGMWAMKLTDCIHWSLLDSLKNLKQGSIRQVIFNVGIREFQKEVYFAFTIDVLDEEDPPSALPIFYGVPALIKRLADEEHITFRSNVLMDGSYLTLDTRSAVMKVAKLDADEANGMLIVLLTPQSREIPQTMIPPLPMNIPYKVKPAPPEMVSRDIHDLLPESIVVADDPMYDMGELAKALRFQAKVYYSGCENYQIIQKVFGCSGLNKALLIFHGRCKFCDLTDVTSVEEVIKIFADTGIFEHSMDYAIKHQSIEPVYMADQVALEELMNKKNQIDNHMESFGSDILQTQSANPKQEEKILALEKTVVSLSEQVSRGKQYQNTLKQEKTALLQQLDDCRQELVAKEAADRIEISYLRRCIDRPSKHSDIGKWVSAHFDGRILLHDRALSMLSQRESRDVDISLLCDALDFLGTDYWETVFGSLSQENMLNNCSLKYQRPFSVAPIQDRTIAHTTTQYHIPYADKPNAKEKMHPLKLHLKVRNDSASLLRIYFFLDKRRQLIVIGSLPHHLKTITSF